MKITINSVPPLHRSSWHSPAQCLAYYGKPYKIREIQIHWWDDPKKKPSHNGVVEYTRNKTGGSVNYVASGGKITKMVPEENCAHTTQDGNPYGIKIECSPYRTKADYETFAYLIADIWKRRGIIPLVPHNKYFPTQCPGNLDLKRMAKEALIIYKGSYMYKNKSAEYWYKTYAAVDAKNKALQEQVNKLKDSATKLNQTLNEVQQAEAAEDAREAEARAQADARIAELEAAKNLPAGEVPGPIVVDTKPKKPSAFARLLAALFKVK